MSFISQESTLARTAPAPVLSDLNALAEQIGSTAALAALGSASESWSMPQVVDVKSLENFLEGYRTRILIPVELPAICQAYWHALRCEFRELLVLDDHLAGESVLEPFAAASRQVGRTQIRRYRPLRDQRLVQRYLNAIEDGTAHGWHTLVYGIVLSIYSLPLRQGLSHYAQQTYNGLLEGAGNALRISVADRQRLFKKFKGAVPEMVSAVVAKNNGNEFGLGC